MTRRLAPAVLALVLALVVGLPALAWAQDMQLPVPVPSGVGPSELGGGLGALAAIAVGIEKLVAMQKRNSERSDREKEDARLSTLISEHIVRAMTAHRAEDTAVHHAMDLRLQALDQSRITEAERWREMRGEFGELRKAVLAAVTHAE